MRVQLGRSIRFDERTSGGLKMVRKTLLMTTCVLFMTGMLGGSVFAGVVVAPGGKEQTLTDSDKSRKKFKCNDGIMNVPPSYEHFVKPKTPENTKDQFMVDEVNLRAGPGVRFCVLKVLKGVKSKSFEVHKQFYSWYLISWSGRHYWVHKAMAREHYKAKYFAAKKLRVGAFFRDVLNKASKGDTLSQMVVGSIYFHTRKYPNYLVKAHMWVSLAKNGGDDEADNFLRNKIVPEMSPALISEAKRLARECVKNQFKRCLDRSLWVL